MMDANQVWDVSETVAKMRQLAEVRHRVAPIGEAPGEHYHNKVMFKQFLWAEAIDYRQIDAARLGGLNEVILVVLMAAKFGVSICPHAGGVGLCEYVQHISLFDYTVVSGSLDGRVLEYVDHLHEYFVDPVSIRRGRYQVPEAPGYSITMHDASLADHRFLTATPGRRMPE